MTRDFKETIRERVQRDPAFRMALLREAADSLLSGDLATAKSVLRDYINATMGFSELSEATHIPTKSLMRMLGPNGLKVRAHCLSATSEVSTLVIIRSR